MSGIKGRLDGLVGRLGRQYWREVVADCIGGTALVPYRPVVLSVTVLPGVCGSIVVRVADWDVIAGVVGPFVPLEVSPVPAARRCPRRLEEREKLLSARG